MSLDERLRSELRSTPLVPPAEAREQLVTVVGMGERRLRRRRIAISTAVAVAVLGVTAVGVRTTRDSTLDVITPSPPSLTAPPASAPASTASTTETSTAEGSVPPSTTEAPTTTSAVAPSTSTAATATTTSRPASTTTSIPGSVPVDLTFTGVAAGHVTEATVAPAGIVIGPHNTSDPSPACTNPATDPSGATIGVQGTLAGRPFLLAYVVGDVHDVSGGLAEGFAIVGQPRLDYSLAYSYDPAKVVVDADRKGGEIDADLLSSSSAVVGHVRGHFRCAP